MSLEAAEVTEASVLQISSRWIRAGSRDEIARKGVVVVQGADRPIAVFHDRGEFFAVDNRCPHMGFPLHRGSVDDGILTCHWHHARFDLCSGCTFDLFADDVPAFAVHVRGDDVMVAERPRPCDPEVHHLARLREGMEQNLPLIQAKSIAALMRHGLAPAELVREAVFFGVDNRDSWGPGLTILTAMANLVPCLGEETAYLALYQGARRTAADCVGQPPRRARRPLESELPYPNDLLSRWLRRWTQIRHRDGTERTLLTAAAGGSDRAALTSLVFSAALDRIYGDGGHTVDFCNKALEALDLIGWDHAARVLPAIAGHLAMARGAEERNAWRHPEDLIPLIQSAEARLDGWFQEGRGRNWSDERKLAGEILESPPAGALEAIGTAAACGARPEQLSYALCLAAATRIARFGSANEFGDWITALHTFTYANAVHQALRRSADPELVRGVLHGAISVHLDRFLNLPPAPLPGERPEPDDLPADGQLLLERFLEALDRQNEAGLAARLVAHYLRLGAPLQPLSDALTLACVREDADFHTFQMVEAALRLFTERPHAEESEIFPIAAARYLAAHAPTQRAQHQTALVALRLHRGEPVYDEPGAEEGAASTS